MRNVHWCALGLLALSACSSVEVPEESFYRLQLPEPAGGELPRAGVLRVGELRLQNSLSGDALMLTDGGVRVRPLLLHRWIAPLERMVTDALVAGLSRSRSFTLVKSMVDPGPEDLWLQGRVLDFHHVVAENQWLGRVRLELWLTDCVSGHPVFRDEFAAEIVAERPTAEAGVQALSAGLHQVVDSVLARMDAEAVFSVPHARPTR